MEDDPPVVRLRPRPSDPNMSNRMREVEALIRQHTQRLGELEGGLAEVAAQYDEVLRRLEDLRLQHPPYPPTWSRNVHLALREQLLIHALYIATDASLAGKQPVQLSGAIMLRLPDFDWVQAQQLADDDIATTAYHAVPCWQGSFDVDEVERNIRLFVPDLHHRTFSDNDDGPAGSDKKKADMDERIDRIPGIHLLAKADLKRILLECST